YYLPPRNIACDRAAYGHGYTASGQAPTVTAVTFLATSADDRPGMKVLQPEGGTLSGHQIGIFGEYRVDAALGVFQELRQRDPFHEVAVHKVTDRFQDGSLQGAEGVDDLLLRHGRSEFEGGVDVREEVVAQHLVGQVQIRPVGNLRRRGQVQRLQRGDGLGFEGEKAQPLP